MMKPQLLLSYVLIALIVAVEQILVHGESPESDAPRSAGKPTLNTLSPTHASETTAMASVIFNIPQDIGWRSNLDWPVHKTSNMSRVDIRQVFNPNAAPFTPLPGNWLVPGTVNIIAPSTELRTILIMALLEAFQLALAALGNIGEPGKESSSFLRYFRAQDRCQVRDVFKALLGPNNLGPEEIHWFTIYWNKIDPATGEATAECKQPGFMGHMVERPPATAADPGRNKAWMNICPNVHWVKLESAYCDQMDQQNPRIEYFPTRIMASTILHEFMHWTRVIGHFSGGDIDDFGVHPPLPNVFPPDGYGPYNAMLLRQNGHDPTKNADSYAWFATESYLLKKDVCGSRPGWTSFGDPQGKF